MNGAIAAHAIMDGDRWFLKYPARIIREDLARQGWIFDHEKHGMILISDPYKITFQNRVPLLFCPVEKSFYRPWNDPKFGYEGVIAALMYEDLITTDL